MPTPPKHHEQRSGNPLALAVLALLGLGIWIWVDRVSLHAETPASDYGAHQHHAGMSMSPEDMKRWVEDYYSKNPMRGTSSLGAPVDTFRVADFFFNNDAVIGDVDTANVFVGETVLWKWVSGFHTTTNGTGFEDPTAGTLWDRSMDPGNQEFAFQFDAPGVVPFFCRPHEPGMPGYVNVHPATDVIPLRPADGLGFITDPAPNPTRAGSSFRFSLAKAGRARVEVFDVRGRLVATPIDRMLEVGSYAALWDGRTQAGERATAGVYLVRLAIPGRTESREVVVMH